MAIVACDSLGKSTKTDLRSRTVEFLDGEVDFSHDIPMTTSLEKRATLTNDQDDQDAHITTAPEVPECIPADVGYYSPAICPNGWTVAGSRAVWDNLGPPPEPSESVYYCCPR
jgi:hypothetical protein